MSDGRWDRGKVEDVKEAVWKVGREENKVN